VGGMMLKMQLQAIISFVDKGGTIITINENKVKNNQQLYMANLHLIICSQIRGQ
jgi:hypothetical protein